MVVIVITSYSIHYTKLYDGQNPDNGVKYLVGIWIPVEQQPGHESGKQHSYLLHGNRIAKEAPEIFVSVIARITSYNVCYTKLLRKEAGVNPYFRYLYRVDFSGKNLTLLTPEVGDHSVSLSPDGKYFSDTYSQPDVPGVTVVRNAKGKLISTLEKTDVSRLEATGWKAPQVFSVKSADKSYNFV